MKRTLPIVLSLLLPALAFAKPACLHVGASAIDNNKDTNGAMECDDGIVQTLRVYGGLKMYDTTVTGQVNVFGSGEFNHAKVAEAVVRGPVLARHSSFSDNLVVYANQITLHYTKASMITVNPDVGGASAPTLVLDHSTVTGDIRFVGRRRGVIHLGKESVIKGQIVNAEVIKPAKIYQ